MSTKTLVTYFSATGTTEKVAKELAQKVGADLWEIKPAVPYTAADLDWMNKKSRSSVERADQSSRPEIGGSLENIGDYDTIFVGFPIWWYVAPTITNTFLESHDFSGKTIITFATSGGSGFGETLPKLKDSCPGATLKQGRLIKNSNDIDELIRELHI